MPDLIQTLLAPCCCLMLLAFSALFRATHGAVSRSLPLWAAWAFLLPFVCACACTFPSLDDWCYGATGRHDWWQAQGAWYQGWSGRVLATALLSSWGFIGSPWFAATIGYRLLITGLFAITCWAIWHFIAAVTDDVEGHERGQRRGLTLAALAGAITLLPDPGEGLYWLPGVATYTLGTVFALIAGAYVLRSGHAAQLPSPAPNRPWSYLMASIALSAACLCSEVVAALALSAVAGLILFHLRGATRWYACLVLGAGFLSTAISLTSPGNTIRAATALAQGTVPIDHHPGALMTTTMALMWGFLHDLPWAPLAALGAWTAQTSPHRRFPAGLLLLTIIPGMVLAAAVPMAWAGMCPPRAWNPLAITTALALILGAWQGGPRLVPLFLLLAAVSSMSSVVDIDRMLVIGGVWTVVGGIAWCLRRRLPPRLLLACLAAALLLGSERFTQAVIDVGRGPDYARQQHARLALLAGAPPKTSLIVPALTGDLPYLYHINDLQFSETTWQNQGCAQFFGMRSVRTVIEPQARK
jgi:Family of unknown function (DUF6056)